MQGESREGGVHGDGDDVASQNDDVDVCLFYLFLNKFMWMMIKKVKIC